MKIIRKNVKKFAKGIFIFPTLCYNLLRQFITLPR
jgi:hypothetical protein